MKPVAREVCVKLYHWPRPLVCVALAAILAVGGVAPARAGSVLCYATPSPVTASTPAAYRIGISGNPYSRIDQLSVKFPFDTGYTAASFAPSAVVVNDVVSKGGRIQKVTATNQIQMDIMLSERLTVGVPVSIVIAREAGIVNPLSPRSCYRLMVSFYEDGREINWVESDLYAITPSAIGAVNASIDPAVAGAAAEVVVSFITGSSGRLKMGQDSVNITFPAGFGIPQSFGMADVTLNGVSCDGRVFRDAVNPRMVVVYAPVDVPAGSLVIVRISAKGGIKCPSATGPIVLTIHTTAETPQVDSPSIQIRGREVTGLTVHLTSPVAGLATALELHFGLSAVGRLPQAALIHIRVPVGYAMPVPGGTVSATINGTPASVLVVEDSIRVAAPAYLADGADIDLVVPVDVGIVNPLVVTGYAWTVWTDSDTAPVTAMAVVQAPSASGATLASSTHAIGRSASWTVGLNPSSPATFPVAGDTITVRFDEAVLVPAQLGADAITVNGIPSAATSSGTTLVVTTPQGVAAATSVTVHVDARAGIRTPALPATVHALVATTRDGTPAATNDLVFKVLPVVTMVVTPDVPNGLAGMYIGSKPSIQLVSDAALLHYRIDAEPFQQYVPGTAIFVPEGIHTLSAYAVAGDGTEGEIVERPFVVDLSRPSMTIAGFAGDILVRSSQVTLTGSVSEPVEMVQINGVPATLNADNTFSVTIAVSDGQALACFARDLAGNSASFVRTIRVDSTAPTITRTGLLSADEVVRADELEVRVTVSEPATLTANGQPMLSAGLEHVVTIPLVKGVNEVTVRAVDRAGNESVLAWTVTHTDTLTIVLAAGSATARVGDEQRTLDAPPIIVNGVTFVPLRFIGEALGAEVTWNDALKVVLLAKGSSRVQLSIGSKLAIIDGRITQLLEAPRIQNGRTMVPLRFISEAFGADVTWDQATKAVTVSFAGAL